MTVSEVDGLKLRGLKMYHTNVVFALANTTSKTQDGIIADTKLKARRRLVEWVLEQ